MTINDFMILMLCVIIGWLIYYVIYLNSQIKFLWHLSKMESDNMDRVINILKMMNEGVDIHNKAILNIFKILGFDMEENKNE